MFKRYQVDTYTAQEKMCKDETQIVRQKNKRLQFFNEGGGDTSKCDDPIRINPDFVGKSIVVLIKKITLALTLFKLSRV